MEVSAEEEVEEERERRSTALSIDALRDREKWLRVEGDET